jgi:hypothetical protein
LARQRFQQWYAQLSELDSRLCPGTDRAELDDIRIGLSVRRRAVECETPQAGAKHVAEKV